MAARILIGPKRTYVYDTRSVGELYFEESIRHGNKTCQIDAVTGTTETFDSVRKRSTLVAIAMRKMGISCNDFVLFCSKNTLDNMIPVVASLYLGAKVSSVDPALSARDCTHCIKMIQPRFIFTEEDSETLIEGSLSEAGLSSTIISFGSSKKYKSLAELTAPSPEESDFSPVKVDCHETAFIYFSSGTTGLPKGICISHFGAINSPIVYLQQGPSYRQVMLHVTSLYWISAGFLMTLTFLTGGCRVLAPKFEPAGFFQIIEKFKVTSTFISPIVAYYLVNLKNAQDYDTSSLKHLMLGGSMVSHELLIQTRQMFKHTHVTVIYGSTEAGGIITCFNFEEKHLQEGKLSSSGKSMVDTEVKVVDVETRQLLGPNQQGEICFKTPYAMKGYYRDCAAYCFDEDGFIITGDTGYYDEDDCLYVIDRLKDMFKYKSWHVVPASLEAVFYEHPAVKEVAVFGIPHPVDEFHPAACVVLKGNSKASVEEIQEFVSKNLAEYQQLRGGIKILPAMPRGPTGKIQRNRIRDIFLSM